MGSLLLHALLGVLAMRRASRDVAHPAASLSPTELEVEVEAPPSEEAPAAAATEAEPSQVAAAPRTGGATHVAAPVATEANAADAAPEVAVEGASGDAELPPSAVASAAAPHLSLSQLGVDGANPFIDRADPAALKAARAARVKARLDKALAQGIVNQEAAAGRGSGSPVLRALEGLVYASTLPLNTHATLSFVIDSSGKVVSTSLGDADIDRPTWLRIAHETARALATRTLPVPKGKSVRLTVAITSRLELPSGADPGLEVDVLGIPVKKGAGPRSTKLDLLNPKNGLVPLSLLGDPADAGSRPRRMVNAHVVSEELL